MSQSTDLLKHDAELILSLFGNAREQKQRLKNIESQLRAQGVNSQRLQQQIGRLDGLEEADGYRCSYQLLDGFEQQRACAIIDEARTQEL